MVQGPRQHLPTRRRPPASRRQLAVGRDPPLVELQMLRKRSKGLRRPGAQQRRAATTSHRQQSCLAVRNHVHLARGAATPQSQSQRHQTINLSTVSTLVLAGHSLREGQVAIQSHSPSRHSVHKGAVRRHKDRATRSKLHLQRLRQGLQQVVRVHCTRRTRNFRNFVRQKPLLKSVGRGLYTLHKVTGRRAVPQQMSPRREPPRAQTGRSLPPARKLTLLVPDGAASHQGRPPLQGVRSTAPGPTVTFESSQAPRGRPRQHQPLRQVRLLVSVQSPDHPATPLKTTPPVNVTKPRSHHLQGVHADLEGANLAVGVPPVDKVAPQVAPPAQVLQDVPRHRQQGRPALACQPHRSLVHPNRNAALKANSTPKSRQVLGEARMQLPAHYLVGQHRRRVGREVLVQQPAKLRNEGLQVARRDRAIAAGPRHHGEHEHAQEPPLGWQALHRHSNEANPPPGLFQVKAPKRRRLRTVQGKHQAQSGQAVRLLVAQGSSQSASFKRKSPPHKPALCHITVEAVGGVEARAPAHSTGQHRRS
mmetsp:Transcript_14609/g.34654  ORF Transcript_14609/g.34654 Transcript_14609/m.34654 type:complete len:534 (+) Transcript_14609:1818-3419(+)